METNNEDDVCCPFEDIQDKSLETARILLTNLGARMLRGLKNQVTTDEHRSLLLCVSIIETEQQLRSYQITSGHHHPIKAATDGESGNANKC